MDFERHRKKNMMCMIASATDLEEAGRELVSGLLDSFLLKRESGCRYDFLCYFIPQVVYIRIFKQYACRLGGNLQK